MKVIRGARALARMPVPAHGSVVTVGVFDGVHRGHQRIIRELVSRARRTGARSVVITFDPHPLKRLHRKHVAPSLMSLDHRIRLIGRLGVDILIVIRFTRRFSRMTAGDFIRRVVAGTLRGREMLASEKFYFGAGGRAGIGALRRIAARHGLAVRVVRPEKVAGRIVGSSAIRRLIAAGRIDAAARLLGRPVSVLGTVVPGSRYGRVLGYPTANINPHHEVVPPSGVYAVRVMVGKRSYPGALNIGVRPTFFSPRDSEPQIEAHIFDFTGSIYGKEVEVFFIRKIREEVSFKDSQSLIAQIRRDEARARQLLSVPGTKRG